MPDTGFGTGDPRKGRLRSFSLKAPVLLASTTKCGMTHGPTLTLTGRGVEGSAPQLFDSKSTWSLPSGLLLCIPQSLPGAPGCFCIKLRPSIFHICVAFFTLQNCPLHRYYCYIHLLVMKFRLRETILAAGHRAPISVCLPWICFMSQLVTEQRLVSFWARTGCLSWEGAEIWFLVRLQYFLSSKRLRPAFLASQCRWEFVYF